MPSPSLASLSDYIDQLLEAICVVDPDGIFVYLSSGCERIFGYRSDEMIGRPMIELVHPDDRERTLRAAREIMAGEQKIDFENRYIRKDGQIACIQWSARWSEDKKVRVAVARDITKHKQLLEQLKHIAFYDLLTQLPNRALFDDRLQQSLARARREQGQLALCFVDLDKFKEVNDLYGHAAGDVCLKTAAERLLYAVRETDTVARLGGDEFVVVMDAVTDQQHVLKIMQNLLVKLQQPFLFEQHELQVSASIGIALFPQHGEDQASLLSVADMAMYKAKHAGGNKICIAAELTKEAGKHYG